MIIFKILFFVSAFVIFWAMIGYNYSIKLLGKIYSKKVIDKDYDYTPTVTVMVVAHNEEKVILSKLENIIKLDYPKDKIKFLIASDNSTDQTNEIVTKYIDAHKEHDIRLFEVKARKGKTNAQNEAQKTVSTEFLVMTDANAMLDTNAVRELMAAFTNENIAYVTGKLSLINPDITDVSDAEKNYWDSDLAIRDIESRIQTITAGNGALYACRTNEYVDFNPIKSHDSSMPIHFGLKNKRCIANHDAIAYEKAGESIEDEFGRKVRMNRIILSHIMPDIRLLNIFKYKWFTYFYFGHRTCRYLLWISHGIIFITSGILSYESNIYTVLFIGQVAFYLLAGLKIVLKTNNKILTLIYYYTVTIAAQWVGVYRVLSGKAKPFWEKAESTR